MTVKRLRRVARTGVALLASTLGLSLVGVSAAAPPASASVSNNCGIVTCTVYLDKQSTRSVNNLMGNNFENLGESVALGFACAAFGTPLAGVACGTVAAAGSFVVKTISQNAVNVDGCLTIKYGFGVQGSPTAIGASLGVSTNTSYCKAGVPLFANGTLVKQASLPYVYVIYGGAKFLIPNPAAFTALGFSWSAIKTISDKDFHNVPRLPAYGTILREQSIPTVYRIENGHKRAVTLTEFVNNGYGRDLHFVADGQLVQIP